MQTETKELVAPTPEQVDAAIAEYNTALEDLAILNTRAQELKSKLQVQVETFGTVPANAKSLKRLSGLVSAATLTYSQTVTVNEAGVVELETFLEKKGLQEIFPRLFALQTPPVYVPPPPKHRRLEGVTEVLCSLPGKVSAAIQGKIALLYGAAISTRPNAPSFKIESVGKGKVTAAGGK